MKKACIGRPIVIVDIEAETNVKIASIQCASKQQNVTSTRVDVVMHDNEVVTS